MSGRTPEEREAARLEREAKRAKKTGGTSEQAAVPPVDPVRYDPEDFVTRPGEPEPTLMHEETAPAVSQPPPEEAPQIPEEPVYDEPVPAGERPMGVKRMGTPGRPSAGSDIAPRERGGISGAYIRYKNKPRGIPKQSTGMKRKGPIALLVVAIVILWLLFSLFQPFKGDGSGNVAVVIPAGSTNGQIADILADDDVIGSSFFFGLRARLSGAKLQSGTFRMKKDMSYGSAIDLLSGNAKPATIKLVLPEGKSRAETAPIVKKAGVPGDYLADSKKSTRLKPRKYGAPKGATLEGFLFPATYEIGPDTKTKQLVNEQLAAFKDNFAEVKMAEAKKKNLTRYDVITIASMIEREAGTNKDRKLIAAVIYNRLKAGMPLGIDATTRYAVNNWTGPLTKSQLASNSAYNTRKVKGLPPGPIGSPGLASMKAAANPASVDYLFYVVKPCGDGAHAFSSTDAEFQKDVAAYDAARAKAGGNDPSPSSSAACK